MRSVFIIIILSFFGTYGSAQIQNNSFENWTDMGNYDVPDQWSTLNHATSHLNIYTVSKWYPGSPGNWYMKITSRQYAFSVINGIAVYGKLDSTNLQPVSGYPYTQQPASFTGQWQHMIWGTSQGSVCATLTKWNTILNKRDTVAIAYEELFDMAMAWEPFSVDFNYTSTDLPDSCMIVLKASGADPEPDDYLWVDNLAFTGTVTVNEDLFKNGITIYPVPVNDRLNIRLIEDHSQSVRFELSDVMGRVIYTRQEECNPGVNIGFIDVSPFPVGTYYLKTEIDNRIFINKIIKY
ncbi:MAG TPA: T9SS type A sorting domain-containing protein [Bacteroidia bacterium]|jgi:hypothetical protein